MLVVEAKNADLSRGFTQLAVDLIALEQWTTFDVSILYGSVTTGDIWKFCLLQRSQKSVVQDINLYRSPAYLDNLLSILMGVIQS